MKIFNTIGIGMLLIMMIIATGCSQTTKQDTTKITATVVPSNTKDVSNSPQVSTNAEVPNNTKEVSNSPQVSTNTGTTKELHIEAYNFGFKVLNDVQINKGDTVKIILTSKEGIHGLSLPEFNVEMGPINPGETKTAEFIADKSGTFDYFCNVPCGPGHRDMKSTLTVV